MVGVLDFAVAHKRIIVYGAGDWAERTTLLLRGKDKTVFCYCVTNLDSQDGITEFYHSPVIEVSSLANVLSDGIDTGIIVALDKYQDEVRHTLSNEGIATEAYYPNEEDYPSLIPYYGEAIRNRLSNWGYEESMLDNANKTSYKELMDNILSKYNRIEIRLVGTPLGAVCTEYIYYHSKFTADSNTFFLLVSRMIESKPTKEINPLNFPNEFLMRKLRGDNVDCIMDDNVGFWQYFFKHRPDFFEGNVLETNITYIIPTIIKEQKKKYHKVFYDILTKTEKEKGAEVAKKIGIIPNDKIVCFFARGSSYFKKNQLDCNIQDATQIMNLYRNSSIYDYDEMVDGLNKYGIKCVRVGKDTDQEYKKDGVVDYPNIGRSDLLDFYLADRSLFYIGDASGALSPSMLFAKPVIFINIYVVWCHFENPTPLTVPGVDLCLYEKLYDKRKRRFLTLKERLVIEDEIYNNKPGCIAFNAPAWYYEHDIIPIKNTAEEIRDVAIEMYEKLQGKCSYDAEDIELRERYWEIINNNDKSDALLSSRGDVGRDFLRKNRWFLE